MTDTNEDNEEVNEVFRRFGQFMKDKTAHNLGALFAEYVGESTHSGWDGYDQVHVNAVAAFLQDLMRYHEGVVKDNPDNFGPSWHYYTGAGYLTKDRG
jgi:hypothetical protein